MDSQATLIDFRNRRVITSFAARLGDGLFLTPALRLLKQHCEGLKLDVLVTNGLSKSLLENNPNVDSLLTMEQLQEAASHEYDAQLILHPTKENHQLASVIQAPIIDLTVPRQPGLHHAEAILRQTARAIGVTLDDAPALRTYDLPITDAEQQRVKALLAQRNLVDHDGPVIGLHLGCHTLAKKKWFWQQKKGHWRVWPLERFVAMGRMLQQRYPKLHFVITGTESEKPLAHAFMKSGLPATSLVGQLGVGELASLLDNLSVYVSCNTGPVHVASTRPVPLLALYDDEYAVLNGPYPQLPQRQVIQAPKTIDITLEAVVNRLTDMLS